jgi:cytochrome c553
LKQTALFLIFIGTTLIASDGADLYKQCVACHGIYGEKKALNRSEIISGWEASRIETALQEYKAGTRDINGMGKLMNGKVAAYSDEEIHAVAKYISELR